jgi:hypothetical protein
MSLHGKSSVVGDTLVRSFLLTDTSKSARKSKCSSYWQVHKTANGQDNSITGITFMPHKEDN